jgi:hypothetical protein
MSASETMGRIFPTPLEQIAFKPGSILVWQVQSETTMRRFAVAIVLFGLGLVVGTAGTDDTLIQDAYKRGAADATLKLQTLAVQRGHARWERDPVSRLPIDLVWSPVSKRLQTSVEGLDALTACRAGEHALLQIPVGSGALRTDEWLMLPVRMDGLVAAMGE